MSIEAQKFAGITDKQKEGLSLGREKGTNHRAGYKHREKSKRKCSESHKKWCAEHPDKVAARGIKTRGEKNWRWKGGQGKLRISIRLMNENRKWMDAVKQRDGNKCVKCGSTEKLESHHIKPFMKVIEENNIQSRDDARFCKELWDISNGITLCEKCHYEEHGRIKTWK